MNLLSLFYEWEIFNLISNITLQANISQCRTRSTQTFNSDFQYSVYVQAASLQNKEVQTRRDDSTNTKNLKMSIYELRNVAKHARC